MSRAGVVWTVLAVLLAAMVGLFVTFFERVEGERWVGFHGEAKRNPYLAAQRLCERLGRESSTLTDVTQLRAGGLPAVDGTLFLPVVRQALPVGLSEELLAWAESGGHLVVLAVSSEAHPSDPILERFDVERVDRVEDAESTFIGRETGITTEWWPPDGRPPLDVAAASPVLELDVRGADPGWSLAAGDHVAVASFVHGQGAVTVLTSRAFLQNEDISAANNAAFVWHLASLGGRAGEVWFVIHSSPESLWGLLGTHGWPLLASVGLLLLLWVWGRSRRFGPAAPTPFVPRRSLMEHVDATGRFLWRTGATDALLASTRRSLRRTRSGSAGPLWAHLPPERQVAHLAERSGLKPEQVRAALAADGGSDRDTFTTLVSHLERIRHSL